MAIRNLIKPPIPTISNTALLAIAANFKDKFLVVAASRYPEWTFTITYAAWPDNSLIYGLPKHTVDFRMSANTAGSPGQPARTVQFVVVLTGLKLVQTEEEVSLTQTKWSQAFGESFKAFATLAGYAHVRVDF